MEEHRQPSNKELGRILNSRELNSFWDELSRMRHNKVKLLLKDRDTTVIDGINTIDKIVGLKENYK
jgi:hypothetical protein